jgi:putative tryptophan/tyrosine transport system substrate-binding protein
MWFSAIGCIVTLTLSLLTGSLVATAQSAGKLPRIGVLVSGFPIGTGRGVEAFRQGLRDLGYVEGQTIALEIRWDEHQPERYPDLADDLVRLPVDLIVAGGINAIIAAKHATRTLPIIMAAQGGRDPVEAGLIASLARPGGNLTGLTLMTPETTSKRLEMLKEVVPSLTRVALLLDAGHASRQAHLHDHEAAAQVLGVQLLPVEVRGPAEFAGAFQAATQGQAQALVMVQSPLFATHRAQLATLALASRLPTISGETGYADAGGLMHYGPNILESWRRAAYYVDKILKGIKPANLPVEQPTQFELVVNLKTAKALGLTMPSHLLVLADQVIQ